MVTLHTMKRVLELDLGLDAAEVGQCLACVAGAGLWDSMEIPLDVALRIVESAEALHSSRVAV